MSLLKMLGGSEGIERLARQMNIDPGMANELTKMLAPAIGSAAKKRAEGGGIGDLLGQLRGEGNAKFFDEPEAAATSEARADGEDFLEKILGSRDATRNLAAEAAARSGFDTKTVEDFLPALAAMTKGGLQKKTPDDAIDGVMSQMEGMFGRSTAEEAPASEQVPDRGPDSLLGKIGGLFKSGGSGKPSSVDMGGKPTHVDMGAAKPTGVSIGGKPTEIGFGMVSKTPPGDGGQGGLDVGSLAKMFDEDGDGSPLDDILEKLMK